MATLRGAGASVVACTVGQCPRAEEAMTRLCSESILAEGRQVRRPEAVADLLAHEGGDPKDGEGRALSAATMAYRKALRIAGRRGKKCMGAGVATSAEGKGAVTVAMGSAGRERREGEGLEEALEALVKVCKPERRGFDGVLAGEEGVAMVGVQEEEEEEEIGAIGAGLVVPGSFNPPHEGHEQLKHRGQEASGAQGVYELTVENPDKGVLSREEVERRVANVGEGIAITRAPLFSQKARLMPGVVFAVGSDTAERVVNPKYYRGGKEGMRAELEELGRRGCRFLVAGRSVGRRGFLELRDLELPPGLEHLFQSLPCFRVDVSSSEIRQRHA